MKIMEKFARKAANNFEEPGVTIAFLGDSVTQGCFEIFRKDNGWETIYDKNNAYHAHLAKIFALTYPTVPVSIINAGISGDNAPHGLERLERDVLSKNPDLVVVCFALNDSGQREEGLGKYADALAGIFEKLQAAGKEIIFMTPNMMNPTISIHVHDGDYVTLSENCMDIQVNGILDRYVEKAKEICGKYHVPVCDCYAKWKQLYRYGADITELLANKVNHPTREMNWLFAVSLFETMLADEGEGK